MKSTKDAEQQDEKRRNKKNSEIHLMIGFNLENSFGQHSIIFLGDLSLVCWSVKHRGIVIDIIDMNDNGGVVFVQVVRCDQPQLVL